MTEDMERVCAVCGFSYGKHQGGKISRCPMGSSNPSPYKYHPINVFRLVKPPTISAGMACAGCQEFNPYAEANTADGKFICWSCKSSGRRA